MIYTNIYTQTQMNLQNPCRHKIICPGCQATNICKLCIVKVGFGHFSSPLSHSAAHDYCLVRFKNKWLEVNKKNL